MNRQRPTFTCCNCERPFGETIDPDDQAELIVVCPYCEAECIVDLQPYRDHDSTPILRTTGTAAASGDDQTGSARYRFPERVPTSKPPTKP